MESSIIRCRRCGKKNKVSIKNIDSKLNCGHCKERLVIMDSPLNIGKHHFEQEVLNESGLVGVIFSTDT